MTVRKQMTTAHTTSNEKLNEIPETADAKMHFSISTIYSGTNTEWKTRRQNCQKFSDKQDRLAIVQYVPLLLSPFIRRTALVIVGDVSCLVFKEQSLLVSLGSRLSSTNIIFSIFQIWRMVDPFFVKLSEKYFLYCYFNLKQTIWKTFIIFIAYKKSIQRYYNKSRIVIWQSTLMKC